MEEIKKQTKLAVKEFFDAAKLKAGDILVIGCSSSEIAGHKIGTFSTADLSKEVFEVIFAEAEKHKEGITHASDALLRCVQDSNQRPPA